MRSSAEAPSSLERRWFAWPGVALVSTIVFVPVVRLALRVISSDSLIEVWSRPGVMSSLIFTVWQTLVSTTLTLVVGLPSAWAFSRHAFPMRRLALAVVTVPFILPTVVVGAAFLQLLPHGIERGWFAVIVAHVYFNIAVVVRTVAPAWAMVDPGLDEAARSLGASRPRAFLTTTLPILRPAIFSAAAIVGFMCFTSYGVVRMLGGGSATIEVEIYRRAMLFGDVSGATVLALGQLAILAVCLFLWGRHRTIIADRVRGRSRRSPKAEIVAWLTVVVTVVPLVGLVIASVRNRGRWSLAGWRVLLGRTEIGGLDVNLTSTITRSLTFAAIATSIAVPIGLLSVHSSRDRRDRALLVPMGVSAVAIALGVLVTYDRPPFDFRSSWWLVPLVHAVVALPFVVRTIGPVRAGIPDDLRRAASTLGAPPTRVWRTIDRPLMTTAIRTAAGLSAALSLGEFGATSLMSRRDTDTLPVVVERLLARSGDLARLSGQGAAVVLLGLSVMVLTLIGRVDDLGTDRLRGRA